MYVVALSESMHIVADRCSAMQLSCLLVLTLTVCLLSNDPDNPDDYCQS